MLEGVPKSERGWLVGLFEGWKGNWRPQQRLQQQLPAGLGVSVEPLVSKVPLKIRVSPLGEEQKVAIAITVLYDPHWRTFNEMLIQLSRQESWLNVFKGNYRKLTFHPFWQWKLIATKFFHTRQNGAWNFVEKVLIMDIMKFKYLKKHIPRTGWNGLQFSWPHLKAVKGEGDFWVGMFLGAKQTWQWQGILAGIVAAIQPPPCTGCSS